MTSLVVHMEFDGVPVCLKTGIPCEREAGHDGVCVFPPAEPVPDGPPVRPRDRYSFDRAQPVSVATRWADGTITIDEAHEFQATEPKAEFIRHLLGKWHHNDL